MTRNYSDKGSPLKPAAIDDATHLAMGKIVRCVAEVETLVIFYFMSLTGMNESQALAAIGQNQISANIQKCAALAALKGPEFVKAHEATFNQVWRDLLFMRNVIAHSRLLGMTNDGDLAFLVLKDPPPNSGSAAVYNVACYPPKAFKAWAEIATTVETAMLNNHQLEPWLKTSPRQETGPHPKAQKQPHSKKAKKHPPQSSPQ